MIKTRWRVWAGVAAGMAIATACASPAGTRGATAEQGVSEARPSALGAVVVLEGGCTAAKVGPKHLLLAARCVTNKPGLAIGRTLRFRKGDVTIDGSVGRTPASTDAGAVDADIETEAASRPDASVADAAASTSPTTDAAAPDAIEAKIAQVRIHPTYLATCGNGACARGSAGGADVADLAVIVLADEIGDVPIAPVELDPVGAGTRVLAVGHGCDAAAAPRLHARATDIAKTEAAAHAGSPYTAEAARVLASSYVTTRGPGDVEAAGALGICSDEDLGAPLFLANGSAIVGVNSNATPSPDARLPMTNQHARVDTAARHGVGAWLTQMGVSTSRACTDADGGCGPLREPAHEADAEATPASGASPDASAAKPVTPGKGSNASDDETSADPAFSKTEAPRPKEVTDDGGCSAAPRSSAPGAGFGLVLAGVATLARRKRRR